MEIILPDRESLELLHDAVIAYSGGRNGIHKESLLLSSIGRPLTYADYNEDYDLDDICAVIIDSVARNHGFNDGSERTALLTAIYTYRVNGVHFDATEKMNMDFDELVMWVVNKKPTVTEIAGRLKELRKCHEGSWEGWTNMFMAFANAMRNSGNGKEQ